MITMMLIMMMTMTMVMEMMKLMIKIPRDSRVSASGNPASASVYDNVKVNTSSIMIIMCGLLS